MDLAKSLPGHVFIGGVATYLHTVNSPLTKKLVESSHDSDLMISLADLSDLRDATEVIGNPRLGKHQVIVDNVAFDVYVERNHKLIIPYDDLFAHAISYGPMRVASLGHLLLLKLEAYIDRAGSRKGDKDERDLVNIGILTGSKPNDEELSPFLRDKHVHALEMIARSRVFTDLCRGNTHDAKTMRRAFERFVLQTTKIAK